MGGVGVNKEQMEMLNLVEKYTAEETVVEDDGVVAIEYVVVAGAIVVGLAVLWGTGTFTALTDKLTEIINDI
jgi:hypothetical protein